MRITIDTDAMSASGVGVSGCLYLLSMRLGDRIGDDVLDRLDARGLVFVKEWLDGKPRVVVLDKSGEEMVDGFIREEAGGDGKRDWASLAARLRELFPVGRKPGTSLQWRDSVSIIASRLRSLAERHGASFTDDEAAEATRSYVESFGGDYRYMQVLKYFIFKNVTSGGEVERSSQLLSWIENAGQETAGGESWTEELR